MLLNRPASQSMQALELNDPISGLYVPVGQLSHELEPAFSTNVPTGHCGQDVPAGASVYRPAAQSSHVASLWGLEVPAGQASHCVAPSTTGISASAKVHRHNRWYDASGEVLHTHEALL